MARPTLDLPSRGILLPMLFVGAWDQALGAGGSYLVDDATVTSEGKCQIESWVRHFTNGAWEASTAPACTRDALEYSLVATRVAGSGISSTSFAPGLKWVTGDVEKNGWAMGVAATTIVTGSLVETTSLYVPATIALDAAQNIVANANAGIREKRGEGTKSLAGVSVEARFRAHCTALAEYYRNGEDRTLQAGLRWSPNQAVSFDLIYGRMASHRGPNWLTTGVNASQ